MKGNKFRYLIALTFTFSLLFSAIPTIGYAQTSTAAVAQSSDQYATQLAAIEAKVESRRKELGIPGVSLVIVKDDKVIYSKGLGYKDAEKKAAVTPDTQFPIASATKAFTSLSVLITADSGKISLDDSPKKHLSYFKINDPETDEKITVRDLLTHSSGLSRTDLAMITGRLSRTELIRVTGEAKPIAKLREAFGYQNIMYAAAGEIVAAVEKKPWEKVIPAQIFKPLGMSNSTMTAAEMQKAKDYAFGYDYNFDTKATMKRPFREITDSAPAGAINSSANDMARWLRFALNGGIIDGKRIVSEKSFAEWMKPQQKVNPSGAANYALGWFTQTWRGFGVVQHGGNIDGFTSLVGMVPEKKLGFSILTNSSNNSLGTEIMGTIWSELLLEKAAGPKPIVTPAEMQQLIGKYTLAPGAEAEVRIESGKLVMVIPNQPPYPLDPVGERKFIPTGLPDGFAANFLPATGNAAELELVQPGRTSKFPRVGTATVAATGDAKANPANELVGKYAVMGGSGEIEVKEANGKVTFNIEGQQPYELVEKAKDSYAMKPLPDTYFLTVRRNEAGKVTAVKVNQPEGEFAFERKADTGPVNIGITTAELMERVITANGGEANTRKITSRVIEADIDLVNQGVKGKATIWNKAPNRMASSTKITAIGKEIGEIHSLFDGKAGRESYTFAPPDNFTGKRLEDAETSANLYALLEWKERYSKIEITGKGKVGEEETYIVAFTPAKGSPFKDYISTTTYRTLRRDGVNISSTSQMQLPYTMYFSDYREVDGIWMPFKSVTETQTMGSTVMIYTSIKHNVDIDEKQFAPKTLKWDN